MVTRESSGVECRKGEGERYVRNLGKCQKTSDNGGWWVVHKDGNVRGDGRESVMLSNGCGGTEVCV